MKSLQESILSTSTDDVTDVTAQNQHLIKSVAAARRKVVSYQRSGAHIGRDMLGNKLQVGDVVMVRTDNKGSYSNYPFYIFPAVLVRRVKDEYGYRWLTEIPGEEAKVLDTSLVDSELIDGYYAIYDEMIVQRISSAKLR